jgi:hypothetical protein
MGAHHTKIPNPDETAAAVCMQNHFPMLPGLIPVKERLDDWRIINFQKGDARSRPGTA